MDVYVSRFAPVIRIKEKAVAALTQNRWHLSSLANVVACRQALTNSRHRRFENQASATNRLSRRLVTGELQRRWKSRECGTEPKQQIAKRLKEFEPHNVDWTISLAYATRRAYSIDTAIEILRDAEAKFPTKGAIPYNLACYHCQLGQLEKAKNYLKKAFEIDLNWRVVALEDDDLKPLWDSI